MGEYKLVDKLQPGLITIPDYQLLLKNVFMNVQGVVQLHFRYTKGYVEGVTLVEFRASYPLGLFYKLFIPFIYVDKICSFKYSNYAKLQPW